MKKHKSTVEFLSYLRGLNIKLFASGTRLRCHAPEGVLTPALRREIGERKQEILTFLHTAVPLPAVVPEPDQRYQPFPLLDLQQAYWVGRSGMFTMGNVTSHAYWELESNDLDLERLQLAWPKLIERHDMLRAVFTVRDGRPEAHCRQPDEVCFHLEEITVAPGEDIESGMAQQQGLLNLASGPLIRLALFQRL